VGRGHEGWCFTYLGGRKQADGEGGVNVAVCEHPSSFVGSDGGRLSSAWAVETVLDRGEQSSFVGGRGGQFSLLVGFRKLWVVRVVTRGRRHRLCPFLGAGRRGAVVLGWPGLFAMVW
jgi:hypothetical protein